MAEKRNEQARTLPYCKGNGHYKIDCYKSKAWMINKNKQEGILLAHVCFEYLLVDVWFKSWWIDTGGSIHVTNLL